MYEVLAAGFVGRYCCVRIPSAYQRNLPPQQYGGVIVTTTSKL